MRIIKKLNRFILIFFLINLCFVPKEAKALIDVISPAGMQLRGLKQVEGLPPGYRCCQVGAHENKYVLYVDNCINAITSEDMNKCGLALRELGGKISQVRVESGNGVYICESAFPQWIFDEQGLEIEFFGYIYSIKSGAFDSLKNVKLSVFGDVGNICVCAFNNINNIDIYIKGGVYNIDDSAFNFGCLSEKRSITIEKCIVNMSCSIFGSGGFIGVNMHGCLGERFWSLRTPFKETVIPEDRFLYGRLMYLAGEAEGTVVDLSKWILL